MDLDLSLEATAVNLADGTLSRVPRTCSQQSIAIIWSFTLDSNLSLRMLGKKPTEDTHWLGQISPIFDGNEATPSICKPAALSAPAQAAASLFGLPD
jgi:hypothetical protein